ncbi:hypothetical protein C8Q75DRAFT_809499 [Abortiporus biennis]|nr:hypothetical protein C8Q75DRAFT_809499 [Abortiporus biennis]
MLGAVAARFPLVAARAGSLVLFTTLELGMFGFVWSQWQQPSLMRTHFKSAIPAAHLQRPLLHRPHAYAA